MAKYAAYDIDEWDARASSPTCTTIASEGNGEARRECGFHTLGKQPIAPEKKLRSEVKELKEDVKELKQIVSSIVVSQTAQSAE